MEKVRLIICVLHPHSHSVRGAFTHIFSDAILFYFFTVHEQIYSLPSLFLGSGEKGHEESEHSVLIAKYSFSYRE